MTTDTLHRHIALYVLTKNIKLVLPNTDTLLATQYSCRKWKYLSKSQSMSNPNTDPSVSDSTQVLRLRFEETKGTRHVHVHQHQPIKPPGQMLLCPEATPQLIIDHLQFPRAVPAVHRQHVTALPRWSDLPRRSRRQQARRLAGRHRHSHSAYEGQT
jgi:hypothetical protein